MADDSTENTSKITSSERDRSLSAFAIIRLLTWKTHVDHLNNSFEGCEFHHGVRDLTSPERVQALVETSSAFLCNDLGDTIEGAFGEWRDGGLHADLHGFEWAEGNIGDEFGRGRGSQVERGLVLISIFSPDEIRVEFLEEFISAVFESSLCAVTEEGRGPSGVDSTEAFSAADLAPSLEVTSVHLRVDLATTFDQIEGCDSRVGETLLLIVRPWL